MSVAVKTIVLTITIYQYYLKYYNIFLFLIIYRKNYSINKIILL